MGDALKCYAVHAEESSTLVFAKHAVVARREGANELNTEFEDVECRRAPWGDGYEKTGVPVELAIDDGWWFECAHCGVRINSDSVDEDELSPLGTVQGLAFCTPACEHGYALERADRKLAERFGAAVLYHKLQSMAEGKLSASPRAFMNPYVYSQPDQTGYMRIEDMSIAFTFPGAKYGGTLRWNDKDDVSRSTGVFKWHASVASGDLAAYHALIETKESAAA